MGRVAEPLRLLDVLAHVERVLDHDARRDPRHLGERRPNVREVMRRDARDGGVEAVVGERQLFGAADDVRAHAGSGVDGDDLAAGRPQGMRRVPAAGRDVEHG